jgi:hypothetical protein
MRSEVRDAVNCSARARYKKERNGDILQLYAVQNNAEM